ncbi:DUF4254 domain-containing protein [Nocardia arizonensis]|uniref:DUF4254 domain-containing protein n=1 Tax=Nocardia arizonensis TaxID=1141647 RepID=UPI0006D117F4|nr:DUF4254 domain-containing protein [Nocardia arizonensis]
MTGPVLPSKDTLLAACRGFPQQVDHPVLTAAAELAVLHQTRERTPHYALAVIDAHRVRLMESIDAWVLVSLPEPMSSARVHTQTMGQVIDRIAQLTSYTYTVLAGSSDEVFADAAANVEELAHGYEELAEELVAGVRRLPVTTTEP